MYFKRQSLEVVDLGTYCDSSWANTEDRKSVGGYVVKLNGGIIHYRTKVQTSVALSSLEAEFITLFMAV